MCDDNRGQMEEPGHADSPAGGFLEQVEVGEDRTLVNLRIDPLGRDWLLRVTGGEAHVGAVATAAEGQVQLSVVGSHKEGPLAEICAGVWSRLTGRVCVAVVGIHQDQATRSEIDSIVDNVREGLDILESRWRKAGHAK